MKQKLSKLTKNRRNLLVFALALVIAGTTIAAVSTFASGGNGGFCQSVTKNHKILFDGGTAYVNGSKLSRGTAKRFAKNCIPKDWKVWNKDYAVYWNGNIWKDGQQIN